MEEFLSKYAEQRKDDQKEKREKEKEGGGSANTPNTDMKSFLSKRNREDLPPVKNKEYMISKKKKIDAREAHLQADTRQDPPLPKDWSIFSPDPETATTTVFLAPSFSGKTSLIVEQLNRLTDDELDTYTAIVLCTESIASSPLKKLDQRILEKMNLFDSFIPEFVGLMKRTNTLTHNRYRYLVIMDDCLRLKGETIVDMILTLRNSGVSTVISIQHSKLLTPAQRQSIHDYYLMNLRLEDLEYLLHGFIASHMRDRLNEEGDPKAYDYSVRKLAEAVRHRLRDYRILHYDQRHDKVNIYSSSS